MKKVQLFTNTVKIICVATSLLVTGVFVSIKREEYAALKIAEESINARIQDELVRQSKLLLETEFNLTDAYVEAVAREKLGLIKGDEYIFVDVGE